MGKTSSVFKLFANFPLCMKLMHWEAMETKQNVYS